MAHLLISQNYLKEKGVVDNNVDFSKLTSVIETVQDIFIQKALGTDLYEEIKTQSTAPVTLTAANTTLLNNYILKIMLLYIQCKAPIAVQYRFMNKGIMQVSGDNATPLDPNSLKFYTQEWKTDAEAYLQMMTDYIHAHPEDYPAYYTNNGIDRQIPSNSGHNIDMFLPDGEPYKYRNDMGPIRDSGDIGTQIF